MTPVMKKMAAFCTAILICVSVAGPAQAQEPTPFPNCRLGVGNTVGATGYDLSQLNVGLYLDWTTRGSQPEGLSPDIEHVQVVEVRQDKGDMWYGPPRVYASNNYKVNPNLTDIASIAAARPGSLWLVGTEMERVDWCDAWGSGGCLGWYGQDESTPAVYARAFHDVQAAIKAADPTAKVAIGSIVEATPLRLEYLDQVWDSYQAQYGYSMGKDIDYWNMHGFTLREVRDSWGAEIPAGLDDVGGFLYGADMATIVAEHRNIARFQEFTVALRTWMAAHGERNKPLINTEYGILYKSLGGEQITPQQVSDYMTDSFDYLFNATDENIGFPADENRLVQGWFWYSVSDRGWNGNLFDPNSKALTQFGRTWKDYVSDPANPLASQPQYNLLVTNLKAIPNPTLAPPGGTATVILQVDVGNNGNTWTATGDQIVVKYWDGVPGAPGSNVIASITLDDLPGCARFTTVEVVWPGLRVGDHTWYVQVEPIDDETRVSDNVAGGVVTVGLSAGSLHLPIILK